MSSTAHDDPKTAKPEEAPKWATQVVGAGGGAAGVAGNARRHS